MSQKIREEQTHAAEAVRRGYESITVNNRGLVIFVVIFVISGAAIDAGIWMLEKHLVSQPRATDAPASALMRPDMYPPPNLQPTESHNRMPWEDLAALHRNDAETFNRLGWQANPQTGTAIIPDSIVAQLADRYARKAPGQPATSAPTTLPGGHEP